MSENKTVCVVAAGLKDPALKGAHRVSKEKQPNRYITEYEPVDVPLTPYYHKMIEMSGELRVVTPAEKKKLLTELEKNPPKPKPPVARDQFGDPKEG
jgi:hypothetical protein